MSESTSTPNLTAAAATGPVNNDGSFSSSKNTIVIIILVLIILSLIGVNLLTITGNILDTINSVMSPVVKQVASMFGYSAGELINTSADVAADVATTGIDIAKGTTQSIGNLLKDGSKGGIDESRRKSLEQALKSPRCTTEVTPEPAKSSESTVAPITAQKPKAGWCYIGDYSGSRGCVEMGEHSKCMSGQVFPSQSKCMKPEEDERK
jgi:hypothetical protein